MTQNRPVEQPCVLVIAATEAGGVTGLNADLRTLQGLGVHACTVVTATTAQSAPEDARIAPVTEGALRGQLESALGSGAPPVHAIKIGLVPTLAQARLLADVLATTEVPVILDPVAVSSTGVRLTLDAPRAILDCLLPVATLVTPNLPEVTLLLERPEPILAANDAYLEQQLAEWRSRTKAPAVLIKGGHRRRDDQMGDLFASDAHRFWLRLPRLEMTEAPRGTGCALASAIAAAMARGFELTDAVVIGRAGLQSALRHARHQGSSVLPCAQPHGGDGFEAGDLPALMGTARSAPSDGFPDCGPRPLGLYPVVDGARWLQRLLPLGVDTIQVRIKDLAGDALRKELERCVAIARQYRARLFVNDHWELALELGAYGVHLGQEDLHRADLDTLRSAGLRLGLSSHCHWEFARARGLKPSYIATGPVFPTTSKDMPWRPQAPEGVAYWRTLWSGQLVAIGGIEAHHVAEVRDAGADGVAMISTITASDDPEATTRALLASLERATVETASQ